MENLAIAAGVSVVAGGVLGYLLATHMHSLAASAASAVTRATTIHTGIAPVDNAAAKAGADAAKAITSATAGQ